MVRVGQPVPMERTSDLPLIHLLQDMIAFGRPLLREKGSDIEYLLLEGTRKIHPKYQKLVEGFRIEQRERRERD